MVLKAFGVIICFLALAVNGLGNNTTINIFSDYKEKSVVFEGKYIDMPTDQAISEIRDNENDDILISFFIKPSSSLEALRLNRPTISNDTLPDTQSKLEEYRAQIQENIFSNNLESYSKVSDIFDGYKGIDIETSKVNSLITVSMEPSEFDENLIDKLNENLNENDSNIDKIYIGNEPQVATSSSLPETFEKINVYDMINNGVYDGSGINVGIVETAAYDDTSGGVIDVSTYGTSTAGYNDYYGRSIKIRPNQTDLSYHADQVAMIAVGNNGIARDSNILSCYSQGGVESYAEWLLEENMNVANGSFGGIENYGIYHSQSQLIDEWIKNYLFTFVAAAGNRTYYDDNHYIIRNDNYVKWPATGYNVISVGNSYESSLILGEDSCYKEMDSYGGSKPNLVAPGNTTTNSLNPITGEYSGNGTSYSAPQVTGCIASLMEEFPYLIAYPELVMSIVTSSASPMSASYNYESGDNYYDDSGLHNQIGSGLLNYEKMREAANQYLSITVPKKDGTYTGPLEEYLEFRVTNGKRIRASLAWLANGDEDDNFTNYDLYLTRVEPDGTENIVKRINGSGNNIEFLDYAVETGGLFRLRVWKNDQNNQNDFLGLSYVIIDDDGGSASGGIEYEVSILDEVKFTTENYNSFGSVYNNTPIEETITASSGQSVDTNRLRVAIIDEHLVLSAKNKDAGEAYLEYLFDDYINTIEYDIGLWSENESLIENSYIALEYYTEDDSWVTLEEFKAKEMGQDKDSLLHYVSDFPELTTGFRFVVKTNKVENDNNRGRVVIGDIMVS